MSTILVDKWMVRAPTTLTMTLDWSAQQVLGSLCSYQDREEERLASPEVPGAGGLRHSTLLTAIWRPVLKWVLMRSTRGRDRGDSDTKARYTNARDSTWGHVRGPLVDCAVLFVYGRRRSQWNPLCKWFPGWWRNGMSPLGGPVSV